SENRVSSWNNLPGGSSRDHRTTAAKAAVTNLRLQGLPILSPTIIPARPHPIPTVLLAPRAAVVLALVEKQPIALPTSLQPDDRVRSQEGDCRPDDGPDQGV